MNPSPCLRLIRSRLSAIARRMGYVVSGNHVFTARDFAAIESGSYRPSVIEQPASHPKAISRLANLVSSTY